MIILEDVVQSAVEVLVLFILPSLITNQASKMITQLNQHLFNTVSAKTAHYNLL